MKILILSAFLVAGAIVQPAGGMAQSPSSTPAGPTIKFVAEQGYSLAVFGSHWTPGRRLVLSVHQPAMSAGIQLRSDSIGTFFVGINNLNLCASTSVVARDFAGHRLKMSLPGRACPPPRVPPTPVLRVLTGVATDFKVTHIDLFHGHDPIVIVRGDAVYVWEAGTRRPAVIPQAPTAYFESIGQGTTPPRACPEVECDAGFYWEFVGMKAGRTVITLRCGPGQVCATLFVAIPVHILPWHEPALYGPSLIFVPINSHLVGIAGSHWKPNSRATFAVRQSTTVTGLEVKATSAGTFFVRIDSIDLCVPTTVVARDFTGDRAQTSLPRFDCRPRVPRPVPVFTLISGTAIAVNVTRIYGIGAGRSVVIRLGDAVYLRRVGTIRPLFVPSVASKFLTLIGRGTTPPGRCGRSACTAGFFWEYVGMAPGQTQIIMNPSCRLQNPRCGIPSYVIPLRITQ